MKISFSEAAERLLKGEVVALPTDTVYGLAARLEDPQAIEALFSVKKRPAHKAFVTQLADVEDVCPFAQDYPPHFEELAKRYWPGALTLVLPVLSDNIPEKARSSNGTGAFRISAHEELRALIRKTGALAMPSANISGQAPCKTVAELEASFGKDFPVVEGFFPEKAEPSTILAFQEGEWKILRQGAIHPKV